jgi:ATP adenylyltransferase
MKKAEHSEGYLQLLAFIDLKMSMSHIYQPVMLKTLLERNGAVSRREIAAAFLAEDQSQLEYYEEIAKRYPTQTLKRHGIIAHERGSYQLRETLTHINTDERAALIAMCDAKLADFVKRRQHMIWKHRSQNFDPIPGSIRWRILRRAMGRCEACGISAAERALHVDHVIPRSWGGSNDTSNFQALCSTCNIQKLNGDSTDFRGAAEALGHRAANCPLCGPDPAQVMLANELAFSALAEGDAGFYYIAPKRHGASYFSLFQPEINAIRALELELLKKACALGFDGRSVTISIEDPGRREHCAVKYRFECVS